MPNNLHPFDAQMRKVWETVDSVPDSAIPDREAGIFGPLSRIEMAGFLVPILEFQSSTLDFLHHLKSNSPEDPDLELYFERAYEAFQRTIRGFGKATAVDEIVTAARTYGTTEKDV